MKQPGKKAGSLLLALAVLTLTSGFNLFSHFCLLGGKSQISTNEIHSCCAPEKENAGYELKSKCCDDEVLFVKFQINSTVSQQYQQSHYTGLIAILDVATPILEPTAPESIISGNLPPPKSGREILTSIRVFRI